jgi:tripartite-type tricarboxylate transporter receptor subunit TctC
LQEGSDMNREMLSRRFLRWTGSYVLLAWPFFGNYAFADAPIYQNKTIAVIAGTNAGGTADLRFKTVISILKKHIPGDPTLVMQYMPGGGGRKAANHIYSAARPDGLTIGAMLSSLVPAAIAGLPGVSYDIDKLIYLGTPYSGHPHIFISRKDAGLADLEKLRSVPGLRVGAQSVGHTIYYTGRMFTYLIGLREPNFVTGYSGPELAVALTRGEVDLRSSHPDGPIKEGWDVNVHSIIEVPKGRKHPHPRYAALAELGDFSRSDTERKLLSMHRAFQMTGNSFVLPPGTPKERVQILQEAMRKTFKDPQFHEQYKKLGDESPPLMPEELEKVIRELPREPAVVDLFKKLMSADPLPPRGG